jgi:hypothetical protein
MMKAVNAKEFYMVASWSVDRLGRSLTDLPTSATSPTRTIAARTASTSCRTDCTANSAVLLIQYRIDERTDTSTDSMVDPEVIFVRESGNPSLRRAH